MIERGEGEKVSTKGEAGRGKDPTPRSNTGREKGRKPHRGEGERKDNFTSVRREVEEEESSLKIKGDVSEKWAKKRRKASSCERVKRKKGVSVRSQGNGAKEREIRIRGKKRGDGSA